jgi:hypothetical protein
MSEFQDAAKAGFEKARLIYDGKIGGEQPEDPSIFFKSTNKLHVQKRLNKPGEVLKIDGWGYYSQPAHQGRLQGAKEKDRPKREGRSILDMGNLLLGPLGTTHALNCGELANIAFAVAHAKLGESERPRVGKALLLKPADHAFCVVGPNEDLQKISQVTVEDLAKTFSTSDVWVADPWLNLCCRIASYPVEAQERLKKWQEANKRIAWKGPKGNYEGWYQPLGKYAQAFNAAKMELRYQ